MEMLLDFEKYQEQQRNYRHTYQDCKEIRSHISIVHVDYHEQHK